MIPALFMSGSYFGDAVVSKEKLKPNPRERILLIAHSPEAFVAKEVLSLSKWSTSLPVDLRAIFLTFTSTLARRQITEDLMQVTSEPNPNSCVRIVPSELANQISSFVMYGSSKLIVGPELSVNATEATQYCRLGVSESPYDRKTTACADVYVTTFFSVWNVSQNI